MTTELMIVDQNFQAIAIIDSYESLIWTERYSKISDFEIYMTPTSDLFSIVKRNRYLMKKGSNKLMIIESIEISQNAEMEDKIIVKGRSLESILDRRIIYPYIELRGNLQNGIKTILNQNIIYPSDSGRRIDNLRFLDSTDDGVLASDANAEYLGDNISTVVEDLCINSGLGYEILLSNNNEFLFHLYNGIDRSYEQKPVNFANGNTWWLTMTDSETAYVANGHIKTTEAGYGDDTYTIYTLTALEPNAYSYFEADNSKTYKINCKPNTDYTFSFQTGREAGGTVGLYENGATANAVYGDITNTNELHIRTTGNAQYLTFSVGVTESGRAVSFWKFKLIETYGFRENDYVVFSSKFGNIDNMNYLESDKEFKTIAIVGGSGEKKSKKFVIVPHDLGARTGLERREVYVDSSGTDGSKALQQKGREEISKYATTQTFDGEAYDTGSFNYGQDYFIGDIVSVVDRYGHVGRCRVTEYIYSHDESGEKQYPTFEMMNDHGKE